MTEPITPTGKRLFANWYNGVEPTYDPLDSILAIEREAMDLAGDYRTSVETIVENAAKAERERLRNKAERWRRDGRITTAMALRLTEGGFWDE